jgi:hypothetical protein
LKTSFSSLFFPTNKKNRLTVFISKTYASTLTASKRNRRIFGNREFIFTKNFYLADRTQSALSATMPTCRPLAVMRPFCAEKKLRELFPNSGTFVIFVKNI